MNVTNNENDQHILLIIASGLAFLAWVIFEPTMGKCNIAGIYYPIGRVVIFWCWLFYLYFKRAKNRIWSWKNFLGGSFSGGWLFSIAGVIIYFFSNFSSDWSFQQKIQPLVLGCTLCSGFWRLLCLLFLNQKSFLIGCYYTICTSGN